MHAIAVFLLFAPPAPARAPEPTWGELQPAAPAPAEAAPVDAVPTPERAEPAPPPAAAQPPPPAPQPVVQPKPPPPQPPPPDRPIRWRLGLGLDVGATRLDSPKWYAVSTKRIDTTVGLGLNFDLRPGGGRLYIGPTLGFRAWGDSDYLHDTLYVGLRVRELLAGARLSIAALDGLDVFVQARGGPVFTIRELGSSNLPTMTSRAVSPAGEAIAGLSLYLPKRFLPRKGAARVTGGLELAAGYAFRGPVDVRATPSVAEDDIPTTTADLGSVPLRGVVWHLGLFIRFM
jgi:hypothetical protein